MNRIKSIFVMLVMALASVSCTEETPVIEYLDVTPNNLSGKWQLVEWNGTPLAENTYFYIEFVRKDRKYTIWQNFDSMGSLPHKVTGIYNIGTDVELGAILSGMYDYDEGFWAHDYEVNDLTGSAMVWVATDEPAFVQKFIRVESLPEDLK